MEDWQEWDYLEDEILVRKRRKICITCNHFRYSTTSSCVTILTCPFHQKLIPQGDHLVKGCRYWTDIFLLARIAGHDVKTLMQSYERMDIRRRAQEITSINWGAK